MPVVSMAPEAGWVMCLRRPLQVPVTRPAISAHRSFSLTEIAEGTLSCPHCEYQSIIRRPARSLVVPLGEGQCRQISIGISASGTSQLLLLAGATSWFVVVGADLLS